MCTSAKGFINHTWPVTRYFQNWVSFVFFRDSEARRRDADTEFACMSRTCQLTEVLTGSCSCHGFFCNMIPKVHKPCIHIARWIPISLAEGIRRLGMGIHILYLTLPFPLPVLALYPLSPVSVEVDCVFSIQASGYLTGARYHHHFVIRATFAESYLIHHYASVLVSTTRTRYR